MARRGEHEGASERDAQGTYGASYEPAAVEGDVAVATGSSAYTTGPGGSIEMIYDNCFVMRFDAEGRCREFTEWFMKRPAHRVPRPWRPEGIHYDADADLTRLEGKTIAILGYGSQGHAHALNLRDSGCEVVVGLRPDSASRAEAEGEGLTVLDVGEAASRGDIVMVLLPDEKQAEAWEAKSAMGSRPGTC